MNPLNKILDWICDALLGWLGVTIFAIIVIVGVLVTPNPQTLEAQCKAAGGQWVQTMKTYHECRFSSPTNK